MQRDEYRIHLKVMKVGACSDGYLVWCVALVLLVVREHGYLLCIRMFRIVDIKTGACKCTERLP